LKPSTTLRQEAKGSVDKRISPLETKQGKVGSNLLGDLKPSATPKQEAKKKSVNKRVLH
jgi:hypothetical protein